MRTVAFLSVLALAACSSNSGAGGNGAAASGGSGSASGSAAAGRINVTDACAGLSKDVISQTIGRPVATMDLKDAMPDSGNGMASSNCVFDFGEARLVQVQLNKYPDGVDAGTTMEGTRDMMTQSGGKPAETVAGLGMKGIYLPDSTSLMVQLDGSTQLTVTAGRLNEVPDLKGKLIALAHRIAG